MRGTEREKFLAWEKHRPFMQFMILGYLYLVETQPMEELEFYIETYHFRKSGVKREDLPSAILAMRGIAIKRHAYSLIGQTLNEDDTKDIA